MTNRRDFLSKAAHTLAAGALISSARELPGQVTTNLRRPDRYDEGSLTFNRKPFKWPGGKTLAVWIIPNVEVFIFDPAAGTPGSAQGDLGVLDYSWREYGVRVGLWRVADALDEAGIKATVALNAGVCEVYPKAVSEMNRRGWEMMGHNLTNSRYLRDYPAAEEPSVIQSTLQIIEKATGKKVRGWLGSGLAESFRTLDILAENGVRYTGDWNNDYAPYRMKVKSGEMYALNYGDAINDITFFGKGHIGEEYAQQVMDQFDTLYAESQKSSRVMGIPIHPVYVGKPLNIRHFQKAVQHMKQQESVWFATGSEILDAYVKSQA